MSKTNDTSGELTSNELDAVSGGGSVNIGSLETTVTASSDGLLGPGALNALIQSVLARLK